MIFQLLHFICHFHFIQSTLRSEVESSSAKLKIDIFLISISLYAFVWMAFLKLFDQATVDLKAATTLLVLYKKKSQILYSGTH